MRDKASLSVVAMAAIFAIAPLKAAVADSLEVSPINLHLGANNTGILNTVNRGDKSIVAQVEAFHWQQSDGKDVLTPSTTLQVSPPIIRLGPGKKQIVRIRVTAKPTGPRERAYRLVVSELPNPAEQAKGRVRVLLQFRLPVFVGGAQTTPRLLAWTATTSGSNLVLRVSNRGDRHVKLAGLHVVAPDGHDTTIEPASFYYVLPGATHEWTVSEPHVTPGTNLHIQGVEESTGTKIDYAVVVHR
ncbi:MAG: hypothetical protein B7Z66_15440 [Chromatiales bacterium 21-64-14]|nr:MAG: hypothetical protein B7Z66_15440 [Chromatiales bacterium 21-64-14]